MMTMEKLDIARQKIQARIGVLEQSIVDLCEKISTRGHIMEDKGSKMAAVLEKHAQVYGLRMALEVLEGLD